MEVFKKNDSLALGRALVTATFLVSIFLNTSLWLSDNSFPLIPFFNQIPNTPLFFSKIVFGILVLLLIIFAFRPTNLITSLLGFTLLFLFLTDINRLQPSFYIFSLLLFCLSPFLDNKKAISLIILLLSAIYFWSGIHKYNNNFINTWLGGLNKRIDFVPYFIRVAFTYAIPLLEASFGIGLLFLSTRKVAGLLLIVMHLIIITSLCFMGIGYTVLPLNVLMILVLFIFIFKSDITFKLLSSFSKTKLALITLVWLLPILNFTENWDHFLSFSILSGKPKYAYIVINDNSLIGKLPKNMHQYISDYNNTKIINLNGWAYTTKGIMVYPETRVYTKINEYVASFSSNMDEKTTTLIEY